MLRQNRAEVPGLLAAIREGRVDGTAYTGQCACLIGTIANLRGVAPENIGTDSSRPAEQWFLNINVGNTPATNTFARLAEEWIVEWQGEHAPSDVAATTADIAST